MTQHTIYNRIAEVRGERNVSRDELARMLGISPQALGHLELGHYTPDLELALRIAEALEVGVETIFSRKPFRSSRTEMYA